MHLCLVAQSCPTLCDPIACRAPLFLGILQARILDCHALLQRISPTQGPNPGFLHCRLTLFLLMLKIKAWLGFPGGSEDKASACNAGDSGLIPGVGRAPGEGNGNSLQYSCLENPMGRGAGQATVHGVAKSRTRLATSHMHTNYY